MRYGRMARAQGRRVIAAVVNASPLQAGSPGPTGAPRQLSPPTFLDPEAFFGTDFHHQPRRDP